MENKLLKELYDYFYVHPELDEQENEVEECHKAFIAALEKPARNLVLQDHRCPKLYHRADPPRQFYCQL